jgi:osmotically-inducible protein OsmY
MKRFLFASLVGGLLAYYLDPKAGAQRRSSIMGMMGGGGSGIGQTLGSVSNTVGSAVGSAPQNVASRITNVTKESVPHQPDNPNPDDLTLRDRVETEIFRDEETSRENINVNVVNGIVTLRGELPKQSDIDDLIARVKQIANVKGVESFLHLPGTSAPNKIDSLQAS